MDTRLEPANIKKFALAGNAKFTVVSKKTGVRFTFRVCAPKLSKDGEPVQKEESPVRFCSVLSGSSYQFLGTVFVQNLTYRHSQKSTLDQGAMSVQALCHLVDKVMHGTHLDTVEVWHSGHCGRCSRELTDPTSIACGIGPDCRRKMGMV